MKTIIFTIITTFFFSNLSFSETLDCSSYETISLKDKIKGSKTFVDIFKKKKKSVIPAECQGDNDVSKPVVEKKEKTLLALQNLESKYNVTWDDALSKFIGPEAELANKNAKNLINKRKRYIASLNIEDCSKYEKLIKSTSIKDGKTLSEMLKIDKELRAHKNCIEKLNASKKSNNMLSILKDKTTVLSKFKNSKSFTDMYEKKEGESTLSRLKDSKTWSEFRSGKKDKDAESALSRFKNSKSLAEFRKKKRN